jgi:hypothetical protein
LICARLKKSSAKEETIGKIKIYRLGWGNNFDKYLLPILGPIKALGLNKKSDFALSWSIMASYGALAAAVFSFLARKAYMISLFEDKARDSGFLRQKMIRLVHKFIFKRSHRLQVIAGLTQAELAAMEMEGLRYVDLEKGWKYVAKKTKEDFQQLEILSSRL